jgi:hypothetical protein
MLYACAYIHTHACTYVNKWMNNVSMLCAFTYIHAYIYTYLYIPHAYMHTCIHTYIYAYIHTCDRNMKEACACIYTHIRAHT